MVTLFVMLLWDLVESCGENLEKLEILEIFGGKVGNCGEVLWELGNCGSCVGECERMRLWKLCLYGLLRLFAKPRNDGGGKVSQK